jgi:hypothetical protein
MSLWKNRPKCSPAHICHDQCINSTVELSCPTMWSSSSVIINYMYAQRKLLPIGRKFTQSGHPGNKPNLLSTRKYLLKNHTVQIGVNSYCNIFLSFFLRLFRLLRRKSLIWFCRSGSFLCGISGWFDV